MKNSRLPLYILLVLVAAALIWRMANPPAPPLPGPTGKFPGWKSTGTLGDIASHVVNPSGTLWAGAWNQTLPEGKIRSAVWIIDFNGYSAKAVALPEGYSTDYLSWGDDNTIRACGMNSGKAPGVAYIDAAAGKVKSTSHFDVKFTDMVLWPNGGSVFLARLSDPGDGSIFADRRGQAVFTVASDDRTSGGEVGKQIGKPVTFDLPKDAAFASEAGVAADGASFMFSVSDPAAKEGKSFYLGDTATGTAKRAFDLGDVPGRIENIWLSKAGVLVLCNIRGKLRDVLYDPATGKLSEQAKGVGDVAKWPGAATTIAMTTYDGVFEFDLSTGKTKKLVSMSKRVSQEDKFWRDFLRDSRVYKLKSGNFVTVSESGGAIDIREIKPDGGMQRALLSRM